MGRPGKILLGIRRRQGRTLLGVWDNGQGIPQHEQDKIFDEFYQVGNKERNRSKGLGLGLPIVKRLCRLNDCQLEFHSQPGKGCYFGILLPATNRDFTTPAPQTTATPPAPSPSIPACHILLLEDDREVGLALQSLLTQLGMKATVAHCLSAASQQLGDALPDAIISDYQLQNDENGLQAIERLREQAGKDIPALLLTGNTSPDTVKKLSQQPLPVLYKPVEAQLLQENILDLLAGRAA